MVSESSDEVAQTTSNNKESDEEYDEELDRKKVEDEIKQNEMKIKRARYASQGPANGAPSESAAAAHSSKL